jgi:hypothetical protein
MVLGDNRNLGTRKLANRVDIGLTLVMLSGGGHNQGNW